MEKNMGIVDRSIRIVTAVFFSILIYTNQIYGTVAIILGVFAIIFILTSLIGWCPLYKLLGISTLKKKEQ
ncbi:DUF2892 domain-containing protein [Candidatus Desantisbacteria bacterium]|nr:DUF2892 domain-containing protein [Candidatus Desantisbacteria bacterium]